MKKNKLKFINRTLTSVLSAAALAFGGCDGGNSSNVAVPTSISIVTSPRSSYEGRTACVQADIRGNITQAEIYYRVVGDSSWNQAPLAPVSGTIYEKRFDLASEDYEWYASAEDQYGQVVNSSIQNVKIFANEISGDAELDRILQDYKSRGLILDYSLNTTIDCGGMLIDVDAAIYLTQRGGPIALWHQGENDGEHDIEKSELENYLIPWMQVGSCLKREIPAKLDSIRNNGWAGGQIASKSLERRLRRI